MSDLLALDSHTVHIRWTLCCGLLDRLTVAYAGPRPKLEGLMPQALQREAYLLRRGGKVLLRGRRRRAGVVEHVAQLPDSAAVQVLLSFHGRGRRRRPAQRLRCMCHNAVGDMNLLFGCNKLSLHAAG